MAKLDWELFHKMGAVLTMVADALEDEGDRVYLGSTNDAEAIRDMKDRYFQYRFDTNDGGPENILVDVGVAPHG